MDNRTNLYKKLKGFYALPIAAIIFAALSFASSCSNTDELNDNVMLTYYNESAHLPTATSDSIHRFATKVESYVIKKPEEKANPLYPTVKQNISQAAKLGGISIVITIDTAWDGDTTIYF